MRTEEYFFTCPYCWEEISMVLDTSVRSQIYVEDCEVCCHPIELRYEVEDGAVTGFEARVLE
jgi:transcription elongation factor Elf1